MILNSESFPVEKPEDAPKRFAALPGLWQRLIELWLSAVIFAFFLIRVLGSQTARRLLARLTHSDLP